MIEFKQNYCNYKYIYVEHILYRKSDTNNSVDEFSKETFYSIYKISKIMNRAMNMTYTYFNGEKYIRIMMYLSSIV